LSQKSFALASGTVTDTIPADFALTDENKADLIDIGHSVHRKRGRHDDGRFSHILASEFLCELPTFKVQYKGAGYGTAYINTVAT
jgi:hypothetical protein